MRSEQCEIIINGKQSKSKAKRKSVWSGAEKEQSAKTNESRAEYEQCREEMGIKAGENKSGAEIRMK